MKLLQPELRFSLSSPLPIETARARLGAATRKAPTRWYLRAWRAGIRFEGAIQGDTFELERLAPYPDPWRPRLRLVLHDHGAAGTRLEADLAWRPIGRVSTVLWVLLCVGLAALVAGGVAAGVLRSPALVLTGIGLLYATFPWLDLRVEARATRSLLLRLLL